MNRSELIDHRIRNLCTERVCVSRLAWFHPSQTELRDRCMSVMKQTYPEVELVFGASSQSPKTRADFVKASFDAQCSKESRYSIPYCTVWKSFFKCLIDRYLHNDTTKDFMQCWSWDISLLHFESAEQWEFEMYYLAQEFAERIKVGNLTPYRMIVDLSDDMNNTDFSSDGDFFRGCLMSLLGLTWYSLKDCLDIKVFCGSGIVPCCFDFPDASKLRHSEIRFDDLLSMKKAHMLK